MPDRIETIKRFAMGGVGWMKTAKGAGMAGVQAAATGGLMASGLDDTLSVVVAAAVSITVNAVRQWIRVYKVVRTDV